MWCHPWEWESRESVFQDVFGQTLVLALTSLSSFKLKSHSNLHSFSIQHSTVEMALAFKFSKILRVRKTKKIDWLYLWSECEFVVTFKGIFDFSCRKFKLNKGVLVPKAPTGKIRCPSLIKSMRTKTKETHQLYGCPFVRAHSELIRLMHCSPCSIVDTTPPHKF